MLLYKKFKTSQIKFKKDLAFAFYNHTQHTQIRIYKMKVGDKVTCTTHPGIWELVWYKEGDTTCAIQNKTYRYIVKVSTLTKIKDESK